MQVWMLKCSTRWDEGYGVVGIYSTLDSAEIGMLDHSAKYSFIRPSVHGQWTMGKLFMFMWMRKMHKNTSLNW